MHHPGFAKVFVTVAVGLMVVMAAYFFWTTLSFYLQIKRGDVVTLPKFSTEYAISGPRDESGIYDVAVSDRPYFGPESAKVTVVEFVDYQCPYSLDASAGVRALSLKYQDQVRFIVRDFPLPEIHPYALAASEAAGCAEEQGKFWPMHDRLFGLKGALARTDLDQAALSIGLDTKAFGACLDSHRRLTQIRADQADGTKAGVIGTPTFFINGQRVEGAIPQDSFEQLIKTALGGRKL